jgi:hypothetical protein
MAAGNQYATDLDREVKTFSALMTVNHMECKVFYHVLISHLLTIFYYFIPKDQM